MITLERYSNGNLKTFVFKTGYYRLVISGNPKPFSYELISRHKNKTIKSGIIYNLWYILPFYGTWTLYKKVTKFLYKEFDIIIDRKLLFQFGEIE